MAAEALVNSTLAVDLGGTNLRVARIGDQGQVLDRLSLRTPVNDPRPDALVKLCRELLGREPVSRAVVAVPGRVDHHGGRLDYAPNLPSSWIPHLSEAALSEALQMPVSLGNDGDLAAIGETWFGAGRGAHDVVYVTVSTGIGAGVILNRRLARGRRSIGELGHLVIDRRGRIGARTIEQLGSGTQLGRRARALGYADAAALLAMADLGEANAQQARADVIEVVALALVNAAYAWGPERILLGGGLGRAEPRLIPAIVAALAAEGPQGMTVEVRLGELGDDAGLIGAAAWDDATA